MRRPRESVSTIEVVYLNKMNHWRKKALETQQYFYDSLGDRTWDLIKGNERHFLESKVAFALFGEPKEGREVDNNGYKKEERIEINKMCDLIYKVCESSEIHIAFLFVVGSADEKLFVVPFFRVLNRYQNSIFIDHYGRVYSGWKDTNGRVFSGWEDFTENNKLPESMLAYPRNGFYDADYQDNVFVTFAESPASSSSAMALRLMDTASSVVGVAVIGFGLASLFVPIVGPLAAAVALGSTSTGIYGIGRSSYHIHDRSTHNQSISFDDREARGCWLSVFGSALGIGGGLATKGMITMAARGEVLGKAGRLAVNMLNFGALTVNGIGIVHGLDNLIEKSEKGELTNLDILQFTSSVLFFTNAAMNAKTATSIMKEVQNDTISSFKADLSKRRATAFKKLVNKSGGDGTIQDRARIIKGITNVESKDEFFRMAVRAQKQDSSTILNNRGNLEVNGRPYVDTPKNLQTHVRNSPNSNLAPNVSMAENGITFKSVTENIVTTVIVEKVFSELHKTFLILSKGIKLDLTSDLFEKFTKLFNKYFSKGNESCSSETISKIIVQSEKLAQERGCETKEDYIDFVCFCMIYKKSLLKDMENRYQKAKKEVKEMFGVDFKENDFDQKWGIQDSNDREGSFLRIINKTTSDSNEDLKKNFDSYNIEITAINENGGLKFRSNYKALNEFYHSFVIDGCELSPSSFFETIRSLVNHENKRSKDEDCGNGNPILITYSDAEGAMSVTVESSREGKFLDCVTFVS